MVSAVPQKNRVDWHLSRAVPQTRLLLDPPPRPEGRLRQKGARLPGPLCSAGPSLRVFSVYAPRNMPCQGAKVLTAGRVVCGLPQLLQYDDNLRVVVAGVLVTFLT